MSFKRNELKLTVSGMSDKMLEALYKFLDDNHYDFVGTEGVYYIDGEGNVIEDEEDPDMTFEERIRHMTHRELQNFIYWVYQNGWQDYSSGCEDSPGEKSYFGGAILNYPADEVIEIIDSYYGEKWRDS